MHKAVLLFLCGKLHIKVLKACFQVGDGTTSVILLAVEFLKQIKPLVEEGVHPQVLIRGYRKATKFVRITLICKN